MRSIHVLALWVATLFLAGISGTEAKSVPGIVTGPPTGTYYAIGKDIASVAQKEGIELEVKTSGGSIDNIKRINSTENAALGIAQSDVLGFLSRSRNPETMKIASSLRMVLPLYREEVHVLARDGIESFKDLQGKKVVVGEEGSGNMLTAVNLLSMMEIKVEETLRLPPPEGVVAVLQGEADAVVMVGGKPLRLFKNLEDLDKPENAVFAPLLEKVHFIPMNDPRMLEEYSVASVTPQDYGFVHEDIPTIAVTAYLVTYDFADSKSRSAKKRCEQIGEISNAIRKHSDDLQENGHLKWKQVDLDADSNGWKKDRCSMQARENLQKAKSEKLLGIVGKQ